MAFLDNVGTPLEWEEVVEVSEKLQADATEQLLNMWKANRARHDPSNELKWGDEMEFTLVKLDPTKRKACLYGYSHQLLAQLKDKEKRGDWPASIGETANEESGMSHAFLQGSVFQSEYGDWMIEGVPACPYELSVNSLLDIQDSMLSRRFKIQSMLPENVYAVSVSAYPSMGGSQNFLESPRLESEVQQESIANSQFIPKAALYPLARYAMLTEHLIPARGGHVPATLTPLFIDSETGRMEGSTTSEIWTGSIPLSSLPKLPNGLPNVDFLTGNSLNKRNPVQHMIYTDCAAFGMGMSCVQATFSTRNLSEARMLYDQLLVLAPLFLAMSASTPAIRGLLSGCDTRWKILEGTVDNRSAAERSGLDSSRFGPARLFISDSPAFQRVETRYNNVGVACNQKILNTLVQQGMDPLLARHFAHTLNHRPMGTYQEHLNIDNSSRMDHFEGIYAFCWQSVRLKSCGLPPNNRIGWRVELRTPDVCLSDFENAAIVGILSLLVIGILNYGWRFYIPMQEVFANMETSSELGGCTKRYWFNTDVQCQPEDDNLHENVELQNLHLLTMAEIWLGSASIKWPGLLKLLDQLVSAEWRAQRCSTDAVERYRIYAEFFRRRADGRCDTDATILRTVMTRDESYKKDSVVTEQMSYEASLAAVQRGFLPFCELEAETARAVKQTSCDQFPKAYKDSLRRLIERICSEDSLYLKWLRPHCCCLPMLERQDSPTPVNRRHIRERGESSGVTVSAATS